MRKSEEKVRKSEEKWAKSEEKVRKSEEKWGKVRKSEGKVRTGDYLVIFVRVIGHEFPALVAKLVLDFVPQFDVASQVFVRDLDTTNWTSLFGHQGVFVYICRGGPAPIWYFGGRGGAGTVVSPSSFAFARNQLRAIVNRFDHHSTRRSTPRSKRSWKKYENGCGLKEWAWQHNLPIGVSEARSFLSMIIGCPFSIRIFCPIYGGSAWNRLCSSCSWMGRYSRQHRQNNALCISLICLKNHLILDHWPHNSHCFRTLPLLTRPALSSSTPFGSARMVPCVEAGLQIQMRPF